MGSITTDERMPHDNVEVWAADPWHKPAQAKVRNFKYQRISYHHAGFYNDFSSIGDYEESIENRLEDAEDFIDDAEERLTKLEKTVLCSKDECCSDQYEWDGSTLYVTLACYSWLAWIWTWLGFGLGFGFGLGLDVTRHAHAHCTRPVHKQTNYKHVL